MKDSNIDFVVTWVDGNDIEWQKEKAKYKADNADVRVSRYRDWDQLKYWFRAVEQNAPWVNKVHFVTWGHVPNWLNIDHPKLNIVKHKDFIPQKYLPVFNSTAIEVHLHRIPNLSDYFVYFCDDFYLMKECKKTDFFVKNKPVDTPVLQSLPGAINGELYYYHLFNDYSIYSNYFNKKQFVKNLYKYLNIKLGKNALTNMLNILIHNVFFKSLHLPTAFLKSTFVKLWDDYSELLNLTALSKFREIRNNSPELFRGMQLITGNFYPKNKKGIILDTQNINYTKQIIENTKFKYICLSDNTADADFEFSKKQINESFNKVFSEKSKFEI